MSSQVYFRLQHGKILEPIPFTGPHIKLIDLKRAILEKKDMKTGFDFDLQISDADNSSKIYEGDDTFVPKNTSVVAKRRPVPVGTGILSRLKARGHSSASGSNEIILPTKAEENIDEVAEPEVKTETEGQEGGGDNNGAADDAAPDVMMESSMEDEEELALLRSITESNNTKTGSNMSWSNTPQKTDSTTGERSGYGHSSAVSTSSVPLNRPPVGGLNNIIPVVPTSNQEIERQKMKLQQKHFRLAPKAGSGYVCRRCQGTDHFLENCPTNGNPAYEKARTTPGVNAQSVTVYQSSQPVEVLAGETQQLHGVPLAARNRVTNLEGIDTTGKVVIFHKESKSYEILESHNDGFKKLVKEGGLSSADAKTAIANAPSFLKCPLTSTILSDAVQMPCCFKIVSDGPVRENLYANNFKCPLCGKTNISLDEIQPLDDVRARVSEFLRSVAEGAKGGQESDVVVVESGSAAPAPPRPPVPPPPAGPPPPRPPGAPPPTVPGLSAPPAATGGFAQPFPMNANGGGMMFPPGMMMPGMNMGLGMMPGMNMGGSMDFWSQHPAMRGPLPEHPRKGMLPNGLNFHEFKRERSHQQQVLKEENIMFQGGPSFDGKNYGASGQNNKRGSGSEAGGETYRGVRQPCKYYPQCGKGDDCPYAHPGDNSGAPGSRSYVTDANSDRGQGRSRGSDGSRRKRSRSADRNIGYYGRQPERERERERPSNGRAEESPSSSRRDQDRRDRDREEEREREFKRIRRSRSPSQQQGRGRGRRDDPRDDRGRRDDPRDDRGRRDDPRDDRGRRDAGRDREREVSSRVREAERREREGDRGGRSSGRGGDNGPKGREAERERDSGREGGGRNDGSKGTRVVAISNTEFVTDKGGGGGGRRRDRKRGGRR